jgi:hypothetical protein
MLDLNFIQIAGAGEVDKTTKTYQYVWLSITYGNGLYIAVAGFNEFDSPYPGAKIMSSPDGKNWELVKSKSTTESWNKVIYGNRLYLAVGNPNQTENSIMTSIDGKNWILNNKFKDLQLNGCAYGKINGKDMYIAVGRNFDTLNKNCVIISNDGINWTYSNLSATISITISLFSVIIGNNLIVAVGNEFISRPFSSKNYIYTSRDGNTWTKQNINDGNTFNSEITYGKINKDIYMFIISDNTGKKILYTSNDGLTWKLDDTIYQNDWISLCFGNYYGKNIFVASSRASGDYLNKLIMISEDGINWKLQNTPTLCISSTVVANNLIVGVSSGINCGEGTIYLTNNKCVIIPSNPPIPVIITQQPRSQEVAVGTDAFFTVSAKSLINLPLTYSWFKDNTLITSSNCNQLGIGQCTSINDGIYFVVVMDTDGNVVSSNMATLNVLYPNAPLQETKPNPYQIPRDVKNIYDYFYDVMYNKIYNQIYNQLYNQLYNQDYNQIYLQLRFDLKLSDCNVPPPEPFIIPTTDANINDPLFYKSYTDDLYAIIYGDLYNIMYEYLLNEMYGTLYENIYKRIIGESYSDTAILVKDYLIINTNDDLYGTFYNQMFNQMSEQLYSQLYTQLLNQLYSQLITQLY